MKIWTSEHTFNHPWETVAQAAWRKYPNPMNPAVIGTDVLDRKVVDGVLHTHRLVSSKWGFPHWAQRILGNPSVCYASEHSEVDPGTRQMILKTRNLSFCSYIAVDETLRYGPHPQDPGKTLLKQEAVVTVQGIPLHNYIENILTNKISLNAGKNHPPWAGFIVSIASVPIEQHGKKWENKETGRQAIEWVISKINTEVKDLTSTAVKSTDEILAQTKKSLDDITESARKSMDDLSTAAKKSLDDIQNLKYVPPRTNQSIPEL